MSDPVCEIAEFLSHFKGKKLDSNEYVSGIYMVDTGYDTVDGKFKMTYNRHIIKELKYSEPMVEHEVDPLTVEMIGVDSK